MPKIKLNFHNLTVPEKIARARQIVAAMTGNTNFLHPTPDLAEVDTAIDELEAASNATQAARLEARRRTAAQGEKEDDLHRMVTQLGAYVESIAGDNEALILSAGLELRAGPTPDSSAPTAPETLTATAGDHDGEIELSWDTVRGARSYLVQYTTNPQEASAWQQAGVAPRSSFVVEGLASGTRYHFRVAAVTLNGPGPWSNLAVKVAP